MKPMFYFDNVRIHNDKVKNWQITKSVNVYDAPSDIIDQAAADAINFVIRKVSLSMSWKSKNVLNIHFVRAHFSNL